MCCHFSEGSLRACVSEFVVLSEEGLAEPGRATGGKLVREIGLQIMAVSNSKTEFISLF